MTDQSTPEAIPVPPNDPAGQPSAPAAPPASPAGRRVLIVEDDPHLTRLLAAYLEAEGYSVSSVEDGVRGLKEILAADFDAVLCDMVMPELAGDMFYLAVQRSRPHICPRFIFMTGHKGDAKVEAFIAKTGGLVLWKPFQMQALLEAVAKVVNSRPPKP